MRPVLGGEMRRRTVRATLSSTRTLATHTHTHTRMPPNYNRVCVSVGGWQGKRPSSFEKRFPLGLSPFCPAAPRLTNCLSVVLLLFHFFVFSSIFLEINTETHTHLYETRDKTITIKIIYECEDEYSACHPANLL